MSFGRLTTAEEIKPLEGSMIRRFTAGATVAAGEIVSIMADGYVDPSDTSAMTAAIVVGIAINAAGAGDPVDVVTFGPVVCLTEATPAAFYYASDTAGEPSASVGTKDVLVGFALTAAILFVNVDFIDRS
jgi:hypothetical protein